MQAGPLLSAFALGAAFLHGATVGSFLNVVAHRLPLGLSVVHPRSRCPACLTSVAARDNVPIVSWLLLGARCRGCKGRIAARYPAVEFFAGLLAAHIAWTIAIRTGAVLDPRAWAHAVVVFALSAALLAASLIDADHQILPDTITKPGMWAGPLIVSFLPELVLGSSLTPPPWLPGACASWSPWLTALSVSVAGVAVGGGVVWAIGAIGSRVMGKEAMGFGDVKFLAMIGGFVGPGGAVLALVLAAFAGSLGGLVRLVMTRDHYIPFGPFLALGGYVVALHGGEIIAWYDGLLHPLG